MTEKFTEAGVAEQKKHPFVNRIHSFASHLNLTILDRLEIHPASMVPQRGTPEPFPGNFLIGFIPSTKTKAREAVRQYIAHKLDMPPRGHAMDDWFTFAPKNGVITHKLTQDVLGALAEVNAIAQHHGVSATKTFGIPAPEQSQQQTPAEPVRPTGLRIAPSLEKMLFGK
ncbi:MAG: hypothetical protein WBK91_00655 [Alphaproteobacteria bacterium]